MSFASKRLKAESAVGVLQYRRLNCLKTNKWSEDDNKFLQEHYSTWKNKEIAEVLQRSVRAISIQAKNSGLKKTHEKKDSHEHKWKRLNDFTIACDCGVSGFEPNEAGKKALENAENDDCGMSGC